MLNSPNSKKAHTTRKRTTTRFSIYLLLHLNYTCFSHPFHSPDFYYTCRVYAERAPRHLNPFNNIFRCRFI